MFPAENYGKWSYSFSNESTEGGSTVACNHEPKAKVPAKTFYNGF